MSLRAGIAAIIAAALWLAGAAFMLNLAAAGPGAYFSSLFFQHGAQALRCFLLAVSALLAAGFAMVSSIAAFRDGADDDDDDDDFPVGAIPFFLVASLGFFWFAINCAATKPIDEPDMLQKMIDASPTSDPLAPVEPEPPSNLETPIDVPVPVAEDRPQTPEVRALPTSASWPYQYPLIRNNGYLPSSATDAFLTNLFPADDRDGEMRALMCGKAWIAISGASSQEGPAIRNRLRSHYRAELAALNAQAWLNAQPDDCGAPVMMSLDLGQHRSTVANASAGGASTAYQRQVLMVSRERAPDEDALGPLQAASEMQEFLSKPANRSALLGAREYHRAPVVFVPENR